MKKIFVFLSLFIFLSNIFSQNEGYWGVTLEGGHYDCGTIYTTNINGENQCIRHSFKKEAGINPYYLKLSIYNDKLYGVTNSGGENDDGVIFEYNPITQEYNILFNFSDSTGKSMKGSLTQTLNNIFLGMTYAGGEYDLGTLFEFNPDTKEFTKLYDFDGLEKGSRPTGSLTIVNEKVYGMTTRGGTIDEGVIFEYNYNTNTFTKLHDFEFYKGKPNGSLLLANNGNLYGMTPNAIFEYNLSTSTYDVKKEFSSISGYAPYGTLIEVEDNMFYGLTSDGPDSYNRGTLFKYDLFNDTLVVKVIFNDSTNTAMVPMGDLMKASNGKLYGLTSQNIDFYGTLFEYDINAETIDIKTIFKNSNGASPYGTLVEFNNNLYGVCTFGGSFQKGNMFKYNLSTEAFAVEFNFNDALNGRSPSKRLCLANNGKLYGTTTSGGRNGAGVLFEYNPTTNKYTKKYDFELDFVNPFFANMGLIEFNNLLYGTNKTGSQIFVYDYINEVFTVKKQLLNSKEPEGFIITTNNTLLGISTKGGINNFGTIYEYYPTTNTTEIKVNFIDSITGYSPVSTLLEYNDSIYYGLTNKGGKNNLGTIFKYNYNTDICVAVFDIVDSLGKLPYGSLLKAFDDNIYGLTKLGGTEGKGVLFQFNPYSNEFTKLIDLNESIGSFPTGSLIETYSGKILGTTEKGGLNDGGVLFLYDIYSGQYETKIDFDTTKGITPIGRLLYNKVCDSINANILQLDSVLYAEEENAIYQWLDCGNNYSVISGENNQIFTPNQSGNYAVEITKYSCEDTSVCLTIDIAVTQVKNRNKIKIYPNPSKGIINITGENIIEIMVYNTMGQCVAKQKEKILDLSKSNKGLYFIKIHCENSIYSSKIIIK